jgi:two-component system NarL family sensor kinase
LTEDQGPAPERRQGERRREERERIRLFEQRIAAEQDERRRIALDLHDGAVQSLSGIALMLDAVGHAIDDGQYDNAKEVLTSALARQRQTIQSLRDMSHNLEPVSLRDQGFEPAVRHLAERLGLEGEVHVDVDVTAGEALAERAQVTFYQVIREALGQAAGRRPSHISISLTDTEDEGAELTVADDGHVERRRENIEAIEERVRPLSGRVAVERSVEGTTVTIALPGYAARK